MIETLETDGTVLQRDIMLSEKLRKGEHIDGQQKNGVEGSRGHNVRKIRMDKEMSHKKVRKVKGGEKDRSEKVVKVKRKPGDPQRNYAQTDTTSGIDHQQKTLVIIYLFTTKCYEFLCTGCNRKMYLHYLGCKKKTTNKRIMKQKVNT